MIEIDGKRYRLVKSDEVKGDIAYVFVEDEEKFPKDGSTYWFVSDFDVSGLGWASDRFDKQRAEHLILYKTRQEAKDELRARRLILAVNSRRRELNAECDSNSNYRLALSNPEGPIYASYLGDVIPLWNYAIAHPFGIFRTEEIAGEVIREFKDDLIWYFIEYLPFIYTEGDYIREVE